MTEDEGCDWDGDGEEWLASLIPVRDELACGDRRAPYVARPWIN